MVQPATVKETLSGIDPATTLRARSGGRRRRRSKRIAAVRIASALDEIIAQRHLEHPYCLYRYIADETGIHPTTVLRYHKGNLGTAKPAIQSCVTRLADRVAKGQPLPFEAELVDGQTARKINTAGRVRVEELRQVFDELLRALGLNEQQFLYRYLAEKVGMHPTTVMRYHRGDLRTAPCQLLTEARQLQREIDEGEAVPFRRSLNGTRIVLRERTRPILQQMLDARCDDDPGAVFTEIEQRLELKKGTVDRIYRDPDFRFVRADVHQAIEQLARPTEYDPTGVYPVDERIHHHLFGAGTVTHKVHKNKVLVLFDSGKRVLLSEAVPEDPYVYCRAAGGGSLTSRGRPVGGWV